MTSAPAEKALHFYARLGGFLYLFVMAAFVIPFVITGSLAAPGDFAQTARNVVEAESLYRISLGISLAGVVAIILLSGAFYALLRTVDPGLAATALALRAAEAVFMGVTVMVRFPALTNYIAAGDDPAGREALHRLMFSAVDAATNIAFAFLALGSTLFFYLFFKSRYIPRLLSGFGMLASVLLGGLAFALVIVPSAVRLRDGRDVAAGDRRSDDWILVVARWRQRKTRSGATRGLRRLEASVTRHISLFTMATTMWTMFLLGGLSSDYYADWPFWAQSALIVLLPTIILIVIVHFRTRRMTRREALVAACWTAFYFTAPYLVYDWVYLGLHQGRGASFLVSHWYLTMFYLVPWLTLPWVAFGRRHAQV